MIFIFTSETSASVRSQLELAHLVGRWESPDNYSRSAILDLASSL